MAKIASILVVDNHPLIRSYMTQVLEKKGYEILTAEDGLSALDILARRTPDVMFVDLVMPNIDGRQLCRVVRSRPALEGLAVVVLSATVQEENVDPGLLGADACLAKGPFPMMQRNVLAVLDRLEREGREGLGGLVLGGDEVHARQITRELLAVRRHHEVILEHMTDGYLEVEPGGRVVYANLVAAAIIGQPEELLLGSRFDELFPREDRARVRRLRKKAADGPVRDEDEPPLSIGARQVSLLLIPLTSDHSATVVIVSDIGERRRLEARVQQTQRMQAIATMAAGVAHEFNNALVSIFGALELIRLDYAQDGGLLEQLEPVRESANRMAGLTEQLLSFARGGSPQPARMSLNELVNVSLPLIRYAIDPLIQVETALAEELPFVEVDPVQMQMVISSIIANSAEAITGRGVIGISTDLLGAGQAEERGLPAEPFVALTITDDGSGMDEKTRARIFEPFFTTKFQGRGLEMAAVYGIVTQAGGFITVDSQPLEGTQVRIYLPVSS